MPSVILSDNGVSSGSAGLKSTAASDGALALQTTTAGGTATTAVTIDTSQNVGLGTASPSLKLTIAGAMNLTNSSRAGAFEITSGGDLWTGTATTAGNIIFETGHTTSGLPSTGTERVKINQYGIGLGATTPSSGMGITFPATQVASSDANTLDDYEEGTWTPVITDGTVSKSGSGSYTKVGNTVWIRGVVNDVESGSGLTGTVYMTGLPFTSAARTAIPSFINYQTGTGSWSAMTATAASQVRFYQMSVNGADDVQISGSDTNTYTDFYVGGVYSV